MSSVGAPVARIDGADPTVRSSVRHLPWIGVSGRNVLVHRILVGVQPLLLTGVAIAAALTFVSSGAAMDYLVMVAIFIIAAVGLDIVVGLAGQLSLGHNALFGISAYTAGIMASNHTANPWVGLGVAVALTTVVAFVVGAISLRLQHFYFALLTLAVGIFAEQLFVAWRSVTGGPSGLSAIPGLGGGTFIEPSFDFWIPVAGLTAGVAIVVGRALRDSKVGAAWRAIAVDEDLAACSGISVYPSKVLAFTISGVFLGVAGFLYARYIQFLDPRTFNPELIIALLVMVAIGSAGSITGPALGVFVVRGFNQLPASLGHYRLVLYGLTLLIVLTTFRTAGLHRLLTLLGQGCRSLVQRSRSLMERTGAKA